MQSAAIDKVCSKKIVLVGDTGAGKTCIMMRLLGESFQAGSES